MSVLVAKEAPDFTAPAASEHSVHGLIKNMLGRMVSSRKISNSRI